MKIVSLLMIFSALVLASVTKAQVPAQPTKPVASPSPQIPEVRERIKEKQRIFGPFGKVSLQFDMVFANLERKKGEVTLTAAKGVHVAVDNRTAGPIVVQGWDQDVIEARAVSERGDEVLIVGQQEIGGERRILLKADYANLENPESPTEPLEMPPLGTDGPIQIKIEVKVPRYAELEPVKVIRSDVEISDVDAPILVVGREASIKFRNVGAAEVHSRSGPVTIENAKGALEVTTTNGAVTVANALEKVRATSIAGAIQVRCVKGLVDVENVDGRIELENVDGDVQAVAASGAIRFTGQVREDGLYTLKSLTGRLEMVLPDTIRGFNATLISYRGMIESDFSLKYGPKVKDQGTDGSVNVRQVGHYGTGSPQITLDSFDGLVRLTKVHARSIVQCK